MQILRFSLNRKLAIMAPSFDQLSDHDFDPEDDEIDFSDLQERYEVHMEQGLDTFVVCTLLEPLSLIEHDESDNARSLMDCLSSTLNRNPSSSNFS